MKIADKTTVRSCALLGAAAFTFFVGMAPGAFARYRAAKPAEQPASVIAHLALPETTAAQVMLQERGDKQYLIIIGRSRADGFTVVDVTRPNQPNVIKRGARPDESSTANFEQTGGQLALVRTTEGPAAEMVSRTETVRLIDWSDPVNPRTIQSFSGVTSVLADEGRNLLYITNSDGLWILKHQAEQSEFSKPHGCVTADAFNEFANCQ